MSNNGCLYTNYGPITIELDTTAHRRRRNFEKYLRSGFYDCTLFHANQSIHDSGGGFRPVMRQKKGRNQSITKRERLAM